MKNDILVGELEGIKSSRELILEVSEAAPFFSTLVDKLSLDKENDFRHSNLSSVDFSHADLRGYDFTGADLRDSHGVDVKVDETTILEDADLSRSIFAKYYREREVFRTYSRASFYYDILKNGDPYEISEWLHQRVRPGSEEHLILKKVDPVVADVLCQKLLTDDIDLTKRTSLFYSLKGITQDQSQLREIVLNFLAFHVEEASVIRSFVKVAGEMFTNDPFISRAIFKLCSDPRDKVREAAFRAISGTQLFRLEFERFKKMFFEQKNESIVKELLVGAAHKLGQAHLLAINKKGKGWGLEAAEVVPFDFFFDREKAEEILLSHQHRSFASDVSALIIRQREVAATTPVLADILLAEGSSWVLDARANVQVRKAQEQADFEMRVSRSYQRQ